LRTLTTHPCPATYGFPAVRGGGVEACNISYSVDYDITVPETTPLEVFRNRFGAVSGDNVHAGATVINNDGQVILGAGRGSESSPSWYTRGKIVQIDVIDDPACLRELDLAVLDD
jgi:hypothetical protein